MEVLASVAASISAVALSREPFRCPSITQLPLSSLANDIFDPRRKIVIVGALTSRLISNRAHPVLGRAPSPLIRQPTPGPPRPAPHGGSMLVRTAQLCAVLAVVS